MPQNLRYFISFIFGLIFLLPGQGLAATTYYVAVNGNDLSVGSLAQPFKTLQKAANEVKPGDTVIVRDGIYINNTTKSFLVEMYRGGSAADGWVTFRAENPGKAILDGQLNTSQKAWYADGGLAYIRIEGFEVREFSEAAFELYSSHTEVRGNLIHNIGRRSCSNSAYGIVGLFSQNTDGLLIEKNIFHDIGRLADGENGCKPTTTYYRNLDHGIYFSQVSNTVIRNNLFYNHLRGWAVHLYDSTGALCSNISIVHNTFAFPNPFRDGHIILAPGGLTNGVIQGNIFYQPSGSAVALYQSGVVALTNVTVSNNIVFGAVIKNRSDAGVTFANNLENTDPKVANAGAADFHLLAGSPAINSAISIAGIIDDFDGNIRPFGTSNDIGAYEYKTPASNRPGVPTNLKLDP